MRLIGLAVVLVLSLTIPPLAAEAQTDRTYRVAYVNVATETEERKPHLRALRTACAGSAISKERILSSRVRYAEGNVCRLPAVIDDVIALSTRCRTASARSTSPLNVPLITGKLGTWTELLPGALITTSKVPLTGPMPVTVDTLSVPVAMTVQLSMRGTVISSCDGHSGVPSPAKPWRGAVAFRLMTPAALGSGSNVTRSLTSYNVRLVSPA
jgi:hypothetical protein